MDILDIMDLPIPLSYSFKVYLGLRAEIAGKIARYPSAAPKSPWQNVGVHFINLRTKYF